jgi:drug/metabolite transporter (DMT)-like permease
MGALFGSLGALCIGLSDLYGRRVVAASSALLAAASMQLVAFAGSLVVTRLDRGAPLAADLAFGALSGVGLGIGLACYYGGISRSSSTVVAPLVATLAAVIPFTYTVATGRAPGLVGWLGALLAFAGLVMITAGGGERDNVWAGLRWGTLSGLAYGFGMAVLTEVNEASGQWPAVSQRGAAFLFLAGILVVGNQPVSPPAGVRLAATMAGLFVGLTSILMVLGVARDPGATVVAISTFPAFSVAVGWLFFRDPVTRRQLVGLLVVLVGVAAVAVG